MTARQPTILLLGAAGQLGRELEPTLTPLGRVIASARSGDHYPCDLSDSEAVDALLKQVNPNHIVNAAAFTSVDLAETEQALAQRLNAELPGQLADFLEPRGGLLAHYSTDYVFAGNAASPYRETDTPDPINAYGKTKLDGENRIRAANVDHLIFRTAWVYGRYGNNFVKTIMRLAEQRDTLNVVDDQFGRPTSARFLADASTQALSKVLHQNTAASGTFHLTANGKSVSWHGFAQYFINWQRTKNSGKNLVSPTPVPSTEFPTPAQRPAYSLLDNSLFEKTFNVTIPSWKTQLNEALPDFLWQ